MGRKRDRFWDYAHLQSNNRRFKCNFCDKDFAGGISRIKSHLSGIKGRDIDICLKVPDSIQAEAHQAIVRSPPCKKKVRTTVSISDEDQIVFVGTEAQLHTIGSSPSNNKGGKSAAIAASNDDEIVVIEDDPSKSRESKKKEVAKKFLKCYQIMDAVSKEASQLLVQLVKAVCEFGPNSELPNFLTPDELISEYERVVKESWGETGFTLMITTVDYDSDGGDDIEVNYFAYCPKGMLLLTSGNLSTAIADIFGVIAEFGEHHCLQIIASIDLALRIKDNYPGIVLSCPSPIKVIQDLVEDFVIFIDGFGILLGAVEVIFTYMWMFSLEWRRKIFKEWKKHKRLKCVYPANYSDELMLVRPIMEQEAEVLRTVVQSMGTSWHSQDVSKWVADVVRSAKFWRLGKELIHIIDILFPLARLVQGTVPAFGYFYEAVNKACDSLDECYHKDPTRYNNFKTDRHILRKMIKPIHAAAYFFNPAIMCGDNSLPDFLMMKGIVYIAENFFDDETETRSFLDQVNMYRAKTPSIFTATASKKSKTLHPWAWWREFGDSVPLLQKCAIRILSQPCDVPLGIMGLHHNASDQRKMKLLLMEKFSGLQPLSLEPIDDLDCRQTTTGCEYDEEYLDDLSSPSNAGATLGLKSLCRDPSTINLSKYQRVHDYFCYN